MASGRRGFTPEVYRRIVAETLAGLPVILRKRLEGLDVQVRERPGADDLRQTNTPRGETLYGMFAGRSELGRSVWDVPEGPDRIVLFRRPLEEDCETIEELEREIRTTLLHEIGHFFGIDEEGVERLGLE